MALPVRAVAHFVAACRNLNIRLRTAWPLANSGRSPGVHSKQCLGYFLEGKSPSFLSGQNSSRYCDTAGNLIILLLWLRIDMKPSRTCSTSIRVRAATPHAAYKCHDVDEVDHSCTEGAGCMNRE